MELQKQNRKLVCFFLISLYLLIICLTTLGPNQITFRLTLQEKNRRKPICIEITDQQTKNQRAGWILSFVGSSIQPESSASSCMEQRLLKDSDVTYKHLQKATNFKITTKLNQFFKCNTNQLQPRNNHRFLLMPLLQSEEKEKNQSMLYLFFLVYGYYTAFRIICFKFLKTESISRTQHSFKCNRNKLMN